MYHCCTELSQSLLFHLDFFFNVLLYIWTSFLAIKSHSDFIASPSQFRAVLDQKSRENDFLPKIELQILRNNKPTLQAMHQNMVDWNAMKFAAERNRILTNCCISDQYYLSCWLLEFCCYFSGVVSPIKFTILNWKKGASLSLEGFGLVKLKDGPIIQELCEKRVESKTSEGEKQGMVPG